MFEIRSSNIYGDNVPANSKPLSIGSVYKIPLSNNMNYNHTQPNIANQIH